MLAPATWPVPALLAVERVEGRRAWLVYAWGATADVPREGWERAVGTIGPDGVLRAILASGAVLEYRLSADQRTLSGTHRLRGVPMFGEFDPAAVRAGPNAGSASGAQPACGAATRRGSRSRATIGRWSDATRARRLRWTWKPSAWSARSQ